MERNGDYLTRAEAIQLLGVKPATLYTYVSRGLIRRFPGADNRQSLYLREDLEKVHARSGARATDGVLAAGAIRYGEPVIRTCITEITPHGPRYRNRSAVELAHDGATFESVAELLWTGLLASDIVWRVSSPPSSAIAAAIGRTRAGAESINLHDVFAVMTLACGMALGSPAKRIGEPATQLLAARDIILMLAGCFGMLRSPPAYCVSQQDESVAAAIARSLNIQPKPETQRALNAALVLCADHELNPATFVARIAASSGGDLHSCVAAAISTNSGTRIARGCDRIEAVFRRPTRAKSFQACNVAAGVAASGFNHPLYPSGDPRGRCLLEIVQALPDNSGRVRALLGQLEAGRRESKMLPRLELSLVVLALALDLPGGAAAGLYTLGRVAGWVAHIAEQRLAGYLIRPRAKFSP